MIQCLGSSSLIEYAGTRYSGWQIQKNARTVAGEIERAVADVTRRREFELYGAGRTDAGVHALAQVAHLELYTDLPPDTLRQRVNDALPADIYIRAIDKVAAPLPRAPRCRGARATSIRSPAARRRSSSRTSGGSRSRSTSRRMREAAQRVRRDAELRARSAPTSPARNPRRSCVDRLEIAEDGDLVLIRIVGSHFLWRMVRRIVGVLAAVGRGELTPAQAARLPRGASDLPATLTAPASGLFLEAVYYSGDPRPDVPCEPSRPCACDATIPLGTQRLLLIIGTNRTGSVASVLERVAALLHDAELLIRRADRHDEDAAVHELRDERRRHAAAPPRRRGSDRNGACSGQPA